MVPVFRQRNIMLIIMTEELFKHQLADIGLQSKKQQKKQLAFEQAENNLRLATSLSPRDYVINNFPLLVRRGMAQEIIRRMGIPAWRMNKFLETGKVERIQLPPSKRETRSANGYSVFSRDELIKACEEANTPKILT